MSPATGQTTAGRRCRSPVIRWWPPASLSTVSPSCSRGHGSLDPFAFPDLDVYYETWVAGGPGAFVMKVTDASQFADAIRRKIVLEITGDKLTDLRPRTVPARYEGYNCLIGEELHESGAR